MEIITSKNNSKVILARKLHDKKYRDQNSLYIFEGYKLFFEAWHCNLPIAYILLMQKVVWKERPSAYCVWENILT